MSIRRSLIEAGLWIAGHRGEMRPCVPVLRWLDLTSIR